MESHITMATTNYAGFSSCVSDTPNMHSCLWKVTRPNLCRAPVAVATKWWWNMFPESGHVCLASIVHHALSCKTCTVHTLTPIDTTVLCVSRHHSACTIIHTHVLHTRLTPATDVAELGAIHATFFHGMDICLMTKALSHPPRRHSPVVTAAVLCNISTILCYTACNYN
jgi:hypothetical protein